ncbi:MAG: glycosyltransferase family protein [Deltaproteobacteria bacterium]
MSSIVYYISGHGYGHAVRSSQVIEALKQASPKLDIYVRTTAPEWLFPPVTYLHRAIDVGVVQKDSLSMDLAATLKACQHLHQRAPEIVAEELGYINRSEVRLILGDIPPLCFEIATRANIPSIAITNFTWDFIYRAYLKQYPDFLPLGAQMQRCYSQASLALALPYSCKLDVFPRREEIPWIARVSPLSRDEARQKFSLPRSAAIVLLSFGGLGFNHLRWEELKKASEYYFVASGKVMRENGNLRIVPDAQRNYADLIRAADVIVTKPGYGIVADAISHQVPVLYTDRGEFPEHPKLVEALQACATAEFIPQADLFAGKLAPYLSRILNRARNQSRVRLNGATVAAEKILSLLGN